MSITNDRETFNDIKSKLNHVSKKPNGTTYIQQKRHRPKAQLSEYTPSASLII